MAYMVRFITVPAPSSKIRTARGKPSRPRKPQGRRPPGYIFVRDPRRFRSVDDGRGAIHP